MNTLRLTIFSLLIVLSGCQGDNAVRLKELELREKELALKEKELAQKASQSPQDYQETSGNYQYEQQDIDAQSEQALKQTLYTKEASAPKDYLSVEYTYRVNLAANTIIEGKIYNSASVAGFKNIRMTVSFYSKTGIVLGEDSFIVMEFVPANGSVSFRRKITGWWENVAESKYRIRSAEPY